MRFSRKEKEEIQKNWRMWKKGKQWICGAALFFTVVASPGMLVLADEVNAGDATEVTAGDETPPLPEGSTENEVEETTAESGTSSPESADPDQQEENTQHPAENNETNAGEGKKAKPKTGRTITQPTAISDLFPDANLAEVIRSKLGKASVSDTVTQSELNTIYTINDWINDGYYEVYGVTNLSGMEHLINLTHVNLGGSNQISDISPLSGLVNLRELWLDHSQISDISPLSGLVNLRELYLNNNQISDISPLSGLVNLNWLVLDRNQISDISSLSSLSLLYASSDDNDIYNESRLSVANQQITLSGINWSNPLEVPFIVNDTDYHDEIAPSSISNNGQFADDIITWNGLLNNSQELTYSWNRVSSAVSGASPEFSQWHVFSGTVTVQVEPVSISAVKILIDADGDSQTAGDQTLFAEEADEDWDSAEDAYNYAKEQLNGTGYGLMSIETDSNGDCVILVSRVGALKKVNTNGTAVGTEVPYTPTYTVTGTGDEAELVVSYTASIDAPPTGYVYIYGKGTTQETRYIDNTPITIPLTDTNGNGTPQWREDYTLVQYQRAGALNPTLPDGSQVSGGTISIPDDAIAGDIITVPDTITGSDGRDYGVDSSVDTDSTTPGVQITLTEDDQDVPYFDILLSESISQSASESVSQSTSESISQSTSESISQSESISLSESEAPSLSESLSTSLSESEASTSESVSLSESETSTTGTNASEVDGANASNRPFPSQAQDGKLAKTGDKSMLSLQGIGAGLLAYLSGVWLWARRKKKA
ncbi:KxYKxGKxW signal peptide domain-containing protein [Listeria sp. FSL L7-0091]|uniref:leucine-rich repeat domain-containing protein n=1 Tax=Listeria farberi TaxID=2713500 RepID=UPI0016258202|nr:leucine-rich repeat domain-containing protein [Listeria farberi]MBC2262500.1 KxYKxGKxW signal peptide domain-containing protein [Listeria farberi]